MNAFIFLESGHPFAWASGLFACAFLFLCLTTRRGRKRGYAAAWALVGTGFALMVAGFVWRMRLGGRAPVTNMYESILWAALGVVLFAMIFEATTRSRQLFLSALPVAVAALLLAGWQPALFDASIRPLPPVLRNNFWLATHVTTITLGYAALALAMGAGHIPLGQRLLGAPSRRHSRSPSCARCKSACCFLPPGRFSAGSGPTPPGAVSGGGTRRKPGRS